jgi:hypothetical protein
MADPGIDQREEHLVARGVLTYPPDDLHGSAGRGAETGNVRGHPTRHHRLPSWLSDGTPDNDDHSLSLAA